MPFYSDMIFAYNKSVINANFFRSEAKGDCESSPILNSAEKTSPQQMIDVYMTPQSEEEDLSDEVISPSDLALSPSADKESKAE